MGGGSNICDEQGSARGSAENTLDIPIRLVENRTQCDPLFLSIPMPLLSLPQVPLRRQRNTKSGICPQGRRSLGDVQNVVATESKAKAEVVFLFQARSLQLGREVNGKSH